MNRNTRLFVGIRIRLVRVNGRVRCRVHSARISVRRSRRGSGSRRRVCVGIRGSTIGVCIRCGVVSSAAASESKSTKGQN